MCRIISWTLKSVISLSLTGILLRKLSNGLDAVSVYHWGSVAAETYGKLRANMEKKGQVMGALDMLIAAHALSE